MNLVNRLRCNETTFNFCIALFFTFILNAAFLWHAWNAIPFHALRDYLFAASLPVVLCSAFFFILSVTAVSWLRKPLPIIMVIVSAAANEVIYSFGTILTTGTVQQLSETDLREASSLSALHSLLWITMAGLLPALLIGLTRIGTHRPWWMNIALRAVSAMASLLLVLLVVSLFYKDYALLVRNNKGLVHMIIPANGFSGISDNADYYWHLMFLPPPAAPVSGPDGADGMAAKGTSVGSGNDHIVPGPVRLIVPDRSVC